MFRHRHRLGWWGERWRGVPSLVRHIRTWPGKVGRVLAVLWLIFLTPAGGRAQTLSQATLGSPQTQSFPRVTAFLDVRDESGAFFSALEARHVTVVEDDRRLLARQLQAIRPGVQLVVAINPARPFAIRDAQGISRYEYVAQALGEWARSQPETGQDDLSLLTTDGVERTHLSSIGAWLEALESYQPQARAATPNLNVLSRALDVAADPPPRPGMGRVVLFLTPPPGPQALAALEDAAARARQGGVHITVWMVASTALFDSPEAGALRALADETGGQFFAYSQGEPFPDLEAYLEPLRHAYRLVYDSALTSSGSHTLYVEVQHPDLEAVTAPQTFELQIAPPNPVFISPPSEITRQFLGSGEFNPQDLVPQTQSLEVLIEFPDGHSRLLARTTLYVDGVAVSERTAPPFDRLPWDLGPYLTEGRHLLQVEAVDTLGLRGTSIETPVRIRVQLPRQDALVVLSRNGPVLAGAAVVLAGAVLVFVLIVGGRIRPRSPFSGRTARNRPAAPATRPTSARAPTRPAPGRRLTTWAAQLARSPRQAGDKAFAHLWPLTNSDRPEAAASPIPLVDPPVNIGSDPEKAVLVLADPSVEALHACLDRGPDGTLILKDQGSVAGTWVNYAPVSREGARLQHGDLIHIGRVGFRLVLGTPTRPRPRITFEDSGS